MPTELIQIEKPQHTELVAEMAPIVALARGFEVVDVESDRIAQENGQRLRRAERAWTEYCEPARKKAEEAKKAILALRDGILGPWAEARAIFFSKSDAYQAAEGRKAEEQERELQERARREEEDRQIRDAQEAQDAGNAAEAEAIISAPVSVPVIHVAPAVAKVKGVSSAELWSAEVFDVVECLRFMLDRLAWQGSLDRLIPELETIFRPFAVAQRQALSIPGVRAVRRLVRR